MSDKIEKNFAVNDNQEEESSISEIISGGINTNAGDFIGRDSRVFIGSQSGGEIFIKGDKNQIVLNFEEKFVQVNDQIERLRGRVTRLIPTEEIIDDIANLRKPKPRAFDLQLTEIKLSTLFGDFSTLFSQKQKNKVPELAQKYLTELLFIEGELNTELDDESSAKLMKRLGIIADLINIHISRLNSTFASFLHPVSVSQEVIENVITKIDHQELVEESNMHLEVVKRLLPLLDFESLTQSDFDILSDDAQSALGVIREIEARRYVVESLLDKDQNKKGVVTVLVIAYILLFITGITSAIIFLGDAIIGNEPLIEQQLPIIGIPWPVLVWSLIGSFTAMIHQFNQKPIHDFGNTVKWLLTRPVQGVILGAAFYFFLTSGLYLLTGIDNVSGISSNAIILALSFLIGFSDKFADGVFDALVTKYSGNQDNNSGETE